MVALFMDVRAAFDSIEGVLGRALKERGVREGLAERVEETWRETRSIVRAGEKVKRNFWTARRVRQGCPLSPLLFNILQVDLKEKMERIKWREIRLGNGRIYSLAYADNIVLLRGR